METAGPISIAEVKITLSPWQLFWQRLKRRWAYFLLAWIDPHVARKQWRALPD
jgi:hypothetical protein